MIEDFPDAHDAVNIPILPDSFYKIRIKEYVGLGTIRSFSKGVSLVLPGEHPRALMYIISGKIRVDAIDDSGRSKLMFIFNKGSSAVTIFMGEKHEFCFTALEKSTICFFSKSQLLNVFELDKEIIFDIMKNLITKANFFMRESISLCKYKPAQRILRLLYNMCIDQGQQDKDIWRIKTGISQKIIGEITGTHPVTVSRLLGMLKREKLISKNKDDIIVYDLAKLENMLNEDLKY